MRENLFPAILLRVVEHDHSPGMKEWLLPDAGIKADFAVVSKQDVSFLWFTHINHSRSYWVHTLLYRIIIKNAFLPTWTSQGCGASEAGQTGSQIKYLLQAT